MTPVLLRGAGGMPGKLKGPRLRQAARLQGVPSAVIVRGEDAEPRRGRPRPGASARGSPPGLVMAGLAACFCVTLGAKDRLGGLP